jgi:DNA-binding CsgD family transcriptional regulator
MVDASLLHRWIDVLALLVSSPPDHDPLIEICAELAAQFDADWVVTVDYSPTVCRMAAYVVPLEHARNYVAHFGDHPLVRYYVATADPATRCLGDADRFFDEPRARSLLKALRADRIEDSVFVPLTALPGMLHRWLVIASSHHLGLRVSGEVENLATAIRTVDSRHWAVGSSTEPERPNSSGLSPRERDVLVLTADGLTATAIGYRLGISARTVHKHQQSTYRKLEAPDRLTAVLRAYDCGLLSARSSSIHDPKVPILEARLSPNVNMRRHVDAKHDWLESEHGHVRT